MDSLKQNTFVLELITLGMKVESVINVLVNFLGIPHLVEETTKNTNAAHPEHFQREAGVGSTATLTDSYGDEILSKIRCEN